jgi:hypothetical protein
MTDPRNVLKVLFDTFDQSARLDFKNFLQINAHVKKWMISADYCLHNETRPNNVFALSVIPYSDHFDKLKREISTAMPRDLKETKFITQEAKKLLCDPSRFHFAFVLKARPKVFNDGGKSKPLDIARKSIAESVKVMADRDVPKDSVDKLKLLQRASASNSFNVKLLSDMFLLSQLFSFVTLALARDSVPEVVGWMSDRDKMTEAYDAVLWVIAAANVHGLAEHFEITLPGDVPSIAVPTPPDQEPIEDGLPDVSAPNVALTKSVMWFDEFIRIPDYVAGVLSAWDFGENVLPAEQTKYVALAQDVIAAADNMAVISVRYGNELQAGRMVFEKMEQPQPAPYQAVAIHPPH